MKYWKAVKKTDKQGVYTTGNVGGSRHTEFEVGETYEVSGPAELCRRGFHFYREPDFVFGIDLFGMGSTFFLEIEPLAEIVKDTEKRACTKIKVLRYIPKHEWLKKIKKGSNSGYRNSGDSNSGNWNSGDSNSGYSNSGYRNSGYRNSGNRNSGYRNSGDSNSGYRNSGNWNSGYRNSGDSNSGNWNSGNFSTGFLNSKDTPFYMFNKYCRKDRDKIDFPNYFYFDLAGNYKECWKKSFKNASKEDVRKTVKLPNFNYKIFHEISGITKKMIEKKLKG